MKTSNLRWIIPILIGTWLVVSLLSAAGQARSEAQSPLPGAPAGPMRLYIIQLKDPALASYTGGIASYAPTAPFADSNHENTHLELHSPQAIAYTDYLRSQQQVIINLATRSFGREIHTPYRYLNVLNAVVMELDANEARQIATITDVRSIYPDTPRQLNSDTGPSWIQADEIWNGNTPTGLSSQGEGIIIGIIDTGINHAHPSFADVAADGYDHTNPWGSGVYGGVCLTDPSFCNDKLIAAYSFLPTVPSAEDTDGHGSNVASIAAGDVHTATLGWSTGVSYHLISGVAPRANLISYKVCAAYCPSSAIIAAINQAVVDGVNVLNYSISGSDDPWRDPINLAFLDATSAGIFVATSADNLGPGVGTLTNTAPWNATVAMSTHSRTFSKSLDILLPYTDTLQGLAAAPNLYPPLIAADITREIAYDATNPTGCLAFTDDIFINKLALIESGGSCTNLQKVTNAAAEGAVAVVMINNRSGPPPNLLINGATIPEVTLSLEDGLAVRDYLVAQAPITVTARINYRIRAVNNLNFADIIDRASSRGPSTWNVPKPDYAAPGVNILGAYRTNGSNPAQYARYTGTSQASPHAAGAAALMIALHPGWSPAAIQSALTTTTFPWWQMRADDGVNIIPANPFDSGSGRLDLQQASRAGLILDETLDDYQAANPAENGDPTNLNQPGLANHHCVNDCAWQRTFTSVLTETATYNITFLTVPTLTLTAEPAEFTISPGATQTITFTANVVGLSYDQPVFSAALLSSNVPGVAEQHLPIAIIPTESFVPDPIEIVTLLRQGTQSVDGLISAHDVVTLTANVAGMGLATPITTTLQEDPTPTNPYNNDGGTFTHLFSVPANTVRLIIEVTQNEAQTLVVYAGTGNTPNSATRLCQSAPYLPLGTCEITNPSAGNYWLRAQNQVSAAPGSSDNIELALGIVISGTAGNLSVANLNGIPATEPFAITLNWDEPTFQEGQRWYALLTLGTHPLTPENIGTIRVNLRYIQPILGVELSPESASGQGLPGDTVTYTLTLTNTGEIADTFSVTTTTNWPISMPVEIGPILAGESVLFDVGVHIPGGTNPGDSDLAVITVTSHNDISLSDSASLTTTALEPPTDTPTPTPTSTPTSTFTPSPTPVATSTPTASLTPTLPPANFKIYLPVMLK